jgi:hypothetical protein
MCILEHSDSMIFIQHIHLDTRTSWLCDLHTTHSLKILGHPDSMIVIQHIHLTLSGCFNILNECVVWRSHYLDVLIS